MDVSNVSSNATADATTTPASTVVTMGIFMIVCCIGAFLLNGFAVIHFARHRESWTPFNIYLIALMSLNVVVAMAVDPLDIVATFFSDWPLGRAACSFYVYSSWMAQCIVPHIHVSISFNRFWAVYFPIHYRQYISRRLVVWSLVAVFIYTHAIFFPFLDFGYVRFVHSDSDIVCTTHKKAYLTYTEFVMYLLYFVPIVVGVVIYPLIAWKIFGQMGTVAVAVEKTTDSAAKPTAPDRDSSKRTKLLRSFYILTFLTLSTLICWTPYNATMVAGLYDIDLPQSLLDGSLALYYLQSVVDPICFVMVLPELRKSLPGCKKLTVDKTNEVALSTTVH